MRYTGKLYRPPSEASSYILQATLGCSWNNCTYCDMYSDKPTFQIRPIADCLEDIAMAGVRFGPRVEKVFVADGDALCMPMGHWEPILLALQRTFVRLRQVSCYAMARNVVEKTPGELRRLRELGLRVLYMGPESGDEQTMRAIAKGPRPRTDQGKPADRDEDYLFDRHRDAAQALHTAGMKLSAIFLLGAGGQARSAEHAAGSARLITAMDPDYLAALTLTLVPGTPLARTARRRAWVLPDVHGLLSELRTMVADSRPSRALFRTNHASNYLPLGGTLPTDRGRILAVIDGALSGEIPLRPEGARGL